jgi:hypothetical protein
VLVSELLGGDSELLVGGSDVVGSFVGLGEFDSEEPGPLPGVSVTTTDPGGMGAGGCPGSGGGSTLVVR